MIILTKFYKLSLVQCREFWDNLPITLEIGLGRTPPLNGPLWEVTTIIVSKPQGAHRLLWKLATIYLFIIYLFFSTLVPQQAKAQL